MTAAPQLCCHHFFVGDCAGAPRTSVGGAGGVGGRRSCGTSYGPSVADGRLWAFRLQNGSRQGRDRDVPACPQFAAITPRSATPSSATWRSQRSAVLHLHGRAKLVQAYIQRSCDGPDAGPSGVGHAAFHAGRGGYGQVGLERQVFLRHPSPQAEAVQDDRKCRVGFAHSDASNAELIRWAFEILNRHDPGSLAQLYTAETVERFPDRTCHGGDEIVAYFEDVFAAVPDWNIQVVGLAEQGEHVFVQWHMTGTHSGPLLGVAPTGRELAIDGIDHFVVRGGKIVSNFVVVDQLQYARQIGMMPPDGSPADRAMKSGFNAWTKLAGRLKRG